MTLTDLLLAASVFLAGWGARSVYGPWRAKRQLRRRLAKVKGGHA